MDNNKIKLETPEITFPRDNPSFIYRAETIERSWGEAVIEPLPFYPHAIEFCRHYGRWWCSDKKSRYALVISVPEGELRYRLDGRSVNISGNLVLVIPPGVKFYFENAEDTVYQKNVLYLLGFNIRDILETLGLKDMQPILLPDSGFIRDSFRMIYDQLDKKTPESMSGACGTSYAVLNYIANCRRKKNNAPALLNVLKSAFSNDFGSKLELESVAATYGVSSKTVSRLFKKHLNMTPGEFRNKSRDEAAKRLLRTSSLSIKEIAEKLGYSNQFHFSSSFKRTNGLSPVQFRREQQECK